MNIRYRKRQHIFPYCIPSLQLHPAGHAEGRSALRGHHNRDTSGSLLNAYNAAGTDSWRGGLTWVGESGPELVSLPQGTQIYSNQESRQLAAAGTDTRETERLMREEISLLRDIKAEFAGMRMTRRMVYG